MQVVNMRPVIRVGWLSCRKRYAMIHLPDWNGSEDSRRSRRTSTSGPLDMITAQTVHGYPSIRSGGLNLREPREGAESALVREYVESSLPPAPRGHRLTVFLEP